jgi:hypothetical protein
MGKPSKQLLAFMEKYGVDSDEVWEVRTGGAWAIKHSALERVAAEQGIKFDLPNFAEKDGANKVVAMLVMGHLGERSEWSIGEASPLNYRTSEKMAAYPYAMAEKRAKDRVILKLLNAHGHVYSEEEADEFKRQNPHVTAAKDIVPEVEYDQNGQPVDNIPLGDDRIKQLPKAHAKAPYAKLQNDLLKTATPEELHAWGKRNANEVSTLPSDWQEILRGQFSEHMADLRAAQEAAQ